MRFQHEFDVNADPVRVWDFFENSPGEVAGCIDGAGDFEDLGDNKYRVKISQRVGTFKANFDMKAEIRDRRPPEHLKLVAQGRSIQGARGDLRASADVDLLEVEGGTRVQITSDVVLGGALGSLGHKVIQSRAEELVTAFSESLARRVATNLGLGAEVSSLHQVEVERPEGGTIKNWWKRFLARWRRTSESDK